MTDATALQRAYYERTAAGYEVKRVKKRTTHPMAISAFAGMARFQGGGSILDVGAGTGRAVRILQDMFPDERVIGVEPVEGMRKTGIETGLVKSDTLIEGDATDLQFADDEFNWVIETGILHHVPNWQKAVNEMVRVASRGIMISDSNAIGQGSVLGTTAKYTIKSLGLWNTLQWVQTRGKMYKYSEGDGVYYSFTAFDALAIIRRKFPEIRIMNTRNVRDERGAFYRTSPSVMVFAYRDLPDEPS